jgi:hypothetical protein
MSNIIFSKQICYSDLSQLHSISIQFQIFFGLNKYFSFGKRNFRKPSVFDFLLQEPKLNFEPHKLFLKLASI